MEKNHEKDLTKNVRHYEKPMTKLIKKNLTLFTLCHAKKKSWYQALQKLTHPYKVLLVSLKTRFCVSTIETELQEKYYPSQKIRKKPRSIHISLKSSISEN